MLPFCRVSPWTPHPAGAAHSSSSAGRPLSRAYRRCVVPALIGSPLLSPRPGGSSVPLRSFVGVDGEPEQLDVVHLRLTGEPLEPLSKTPGHLEVQVHERLLTRFSPCRRQRRVLDVATISWVPRATGDACRLYRFRARRLPTSRRVSSPGGPDGSPSGVAGVRRPPCRLTPFSSALPAAGRAGPFPSCVHGADRQRPARLRQVHGDQQPVHPPVVA